MASGLPHGTLSTEPCVFSVWCLLPSVVEHHLCAVSADTRRGCQSPRTGVTDGTSVWVLGTAYRFSV